MNEAELATRIIFPELYKTQEVIKEQIQTSLYERGLLFDDAFLLTKEKRFRSRWRNFLYDYWVELSVVAVVILLFATGMIRIG